MKNKIKHSIALAVIIMLVFFVVKQLSTSPSQKYFNKIELSNHNYVVNETLTSYLDTILKVGLKELDLPQVYVRIKKLNRGIRVGDLEYRAYINGQNRSYIIHIINVNRRESIEILAHELIHLKDYLNKDLVLSKDKKTLVYKGTTYDLDYLPEYSERLWEVNAFKEGPELAKKIEAILYE